MTEYIKLATNKNAETIQALVDLCYELSISDSEIVSKMIRDILDENWIDYE